MRSTCLSSSQSNMPLVSANATMDKGNPTPGQKAWSRLSWTGRRPEISNKHHTGMKKTKQLWLIALVWGLFSACGEISPTEVYTGVPLVILDTDLGSSTDDLFALEMLHRYQQEGRCRLLGVVVDRMGEPNAAVADVMNTWFGYPDTPIGLVRKGIPAPRVWIDYGAMPGYTDADA